MHTHTHKHTVTYLFTHTVTLTIHVHIMATLIVTHTFTFTHKSYNQTLIIVPPTLPHILYMHTLKYKFMLTYLYLNTHIQFILPIPNAPSLSKC